MKRKIFPCVKDIPTNLLYKVVHLGINHKQTHCGLMILKVTRWLKGYSQKPPAIRLPNICSS